MADRAELSPWWSGIAPLDHEIDCRGERHLLRWAEGQLTTPDHRGAGRRPPVRKGDPPRREDDASLTGDGCDLVVRAWRALRTDPRTLVLGQRHPGDTIETNADGRVAADPVAHLLTVVGPGLGRRLQAEAATALGQTVEDPGSLPPGEAARAEMLLEVATVGRVRPVLDRWLGAGHRARVELGARSTVAAGARPLVTLAPRWLGTVWGRYLNVVDGFLLLEIVRIVDDRAEVIGISRPGGEVAVLTLAGPAPWRARSRQPVTGPPGSSGSSRSSGASG